MNGYPTTIINDFLNTQATIQYNGGDVSDANPFPVLLKTTDPIAISFSNLTIKSEQTGQIPAGSNFIGSVNVGFNSSNVTLLNPLPVVLSNAAESVAIDAFGRARTSSSFTLADYKHAYGIDTNFLSNIFNGGSVNFFRNKACCTLATSTAADSHTVHQSRAYHHYQPGKSHLIMASFNFQGSTTNVSKRTGYFDDDDGIFLELNGVNVPSINLRSFVTGAAATLSIPQSAWNKDRFDGMGPSGVNILWDRTQLFFIDFQWLGVGRVRTGFSYNGLDIIAHEFYNANFNNVVYMANPNLPIRCEILNTGGGGNIGVMDQICSTVISEGGYVEAGIDFAIQTDLPIRSLTASVGATLPLLAIKMAPSFNGYKNRIMVRLKEAAVTSLDQLVSYKLLRLDSESAVVGGSWSNVPGGSAVQYNSTATSLTVTSPEFANGFAVAGGQGSGQFSSADRIAGSEAKTNFICQNYDSTNSQTYVLYCTNLSASTARVLGGMKWQEVY